MSEVATYSPATSLVPHSMDEALRLAEFMARARTVPKHLQDSPGDCLMVIEQAMRWGMSPFAVAQATSVISGKLMYEGKLVAAAVETSGAIVGHIDYDFAGEGDGRSITVSATRRGETNPRTVTVAFKEARTGNEMWKRQPDQQLTYHGVRVWARRWTPAVILGVYSREEMGPIIEGEAIESTATDAREQMNRDVPLKAAASDVKRAAKIADKAKVYEAVDEDVSKYADIYAKHDIAIELLDETEGRKWLDNLEMLLANATTQETVVVISDHESVKRAIAKAPGAIKARVSEVLAKAYKRFAEPEGDKPTEDDEVLITGEHNVMAGD